MKKTKIIGLATATLLAVAPIVSTSVVSAADITQTSDSATQNTNANQASTLPIAVQFIQDGKIENINPDGMYFQVSPNSSFNPTEFTGSNGSQFKIVAANNQKVTVDSNTVDTSKAGSVGTVKLTVGTNSVTYNVLVTPEGQQALNLTPRDWVYGAPYGGGQPIFRQGEKYYIGSLTKVIDGETYTNISEQSEAQANDAKNNYWIPTKYLANTNPAPNLVQKTVMHKALAYSKGGGSKYRYYNAFRTIYVNSEPVSFNGGQYYQVFNADGTYTSDYLKVSNIDGTKRTLKKNAYIYATSKRRADRTLLRKGQTITTYGGSYKFKNGKRYYRIEGATATNKRYVRVVNFE